jgi:hypothetical protein
MQSVYIILTWQGNRYNGCHNHGTILSVYQNKDKAEYQLKQFIDQCITVHNGVLRYHTNEQSYYVELHNLNLEYLVFQLIEEQLKD